jgi:predicted RNA-binding protein
MKLRRYRVTIEFETDADEDLVAHIDDDMKTQLEALEEDFDAEVNLLSAKTEKLDA